MLMIGEYIKYKLNSKGKHQIHSPFVFSFVTECLPKKISIEHKKIIKDYKNRLKSNSKVIEIKDFGAGSKKLGLKRSIRQIFNNAASKGIFSKLLYQLNVYYDCKSVLEFGTSLGVGTLHLALGNPNSKIITVDACEETQLVAKKYLDKNNISNIEFQNLTFNDYIETLTQQKFDLIFIDGHHDGKALLSYLDKLERFIHDDTIIVLDDIRWSNEMLQSWSEIVSSKKYNLSFDLFRMGIIFPRPQQAKEHFVIKMKKIIQGMI
jgi:predicted O-methyltransferase YrrM